MREEGWLTMLELLEELVARLESGAADPAIETLERAALLLHASLGRLEAAIRARRAVA